MITLLAMPASFYRPLETIPYCTVEGETLTMNVFIPAQTPEPTPAMIDIHGGWFVGGGPAEAVPGVLAKRGVAFFSIAYRLGDKGGFPQCVRDCRNAVRFIRKNARRFNIDPNRIGVMGGSAGGYLSLMVAMVPERFDDGGPVSELEGVTAKVCGAFAWIAPTDLVQFWNQSPDDTLIAANGTKGFRHWDDNVPNDARPHLRSLFHGVAPDSMRGATLYRRLSPIAYVRKGLPPLLICDGEYDPIVPGTMGKSLHARLQSVGAESTYWLSANGHEFPAGEGFDAVLDGFLDRIFAVASNVP